MVLRQNLLIVSALLLVSCIHSGIMQDVEVKLAYPNNVVSIEADTTLFSFTEVLNCLDIKIVNDTVLVLMDQANDINPYHFKAYSTDTFEYLGSFIRKGRGPGEMLSPYVMRTNPDEKYLTLRDNSVSQVFVVDVEKSVKSQETSVLFNSDLPSGTFDCFILPDSMQFRSQIENKEIIFRIIDKDGNEAETFSPYKGIDGERYMTYFSDILVSNWKNGKVAEAMIFFPQINIFDTENGTLKSVAVDKYYRKWKLVMSKMIGPDSRQYYVGASSSQDYIFAAYKNVTLAELMKGGQGTSIHVFDWEGTFLYDIRVKEDIECMAFDSRTEYLYCIERSERNIVRYDLSELL